MTPPGSAPTDIETDAAVSRAGPVPLYHQIFLTLRDRILDGTFPAGATLPAEQEIAARFGVSRITAKRALDEVAARGLVTRERGRGTRVVPRPPGPPLLASVEGLLENNLAMGMQTSVQVLEFGYVPADETVAEALRVARGVPVQHAVRVRSMVDLPFSHITTWVPEAVGRSFDRADLANRPLLLLLERAGIQVARAVQSIGAEPAGPAVARALHVAPGHALLRIERIVFDGADRPVEYIRALYCPDRYQYRMELKRMAATGGNLWRSAE